MTSTLLSILVGAALLIGSTPVFAQNSDHAAQVAERNAVIRSLAKGHGFTSDEVAYQFLPEARVMRVKKKEATEQVLQRVGARNTDVLDHRGSLLYIRRATPGRTAALAETVGRERLLPVALNTQNGLLVMLPGSIVVTPKNITQAQQLASDHGLTLAGAYPHLNTAFFEVRPGQDVLAAARALAADARVTRAEPEVIAALHEPR